MQLNRLVCCTLLLTSFTLPAFADSPAPATGVDAIAPASAVSATTPASSVSATAPAPASGVSAAQTGDNSIPFTSLVFRNVKHVLTAPARWDDSDWHTLEWGSVAVVGTALVIDHPWRDEMRRHFPNNNPVIKQVERFGAQYSPAVVGGFFIAGLAGSDSAMDTAEDAFSASLIASGIITPSIKLLAGRARPRVNMGVNYFKPFSNRNSSFPSGHTTEAFVLASVVSGHYTSTWVSCLSYGIAGTVGLARTYHDAHFASDVLAGALIGGFTGHTVVKYSDRLRSGRGMTVAVLPDLEPGVTGIRLVGNF